MVEYCGICNKSYRTRFEKLYHYDIEHNEFCPICDRKMDGGKTAKVIHIQFHGEHPCSYCWRIFPKLEELCKHIDDPQTHLYRCNKCRLDFGNNSDMWIHYEREHFISCNLCSDRISADFCFKLSRDEHYRTTHSMFPCRSCYEVFLYESEYNEHFKKKHRTPCNVCDDTFPDKDSKDRHFVKIHQVQCKICDRHFNTQLEFQHHYNDIHRIHCGGCNETFPDEEVAGRHNDRFHNHPCLRCQHICGSAMKLQLHYITKHQWKCTICDGMYESEAMRLRHIQIVHQFPCSVCKMVLDTLQAKDQHIKLLHQVKCDICDKIATTIAELQLHYNVVHQLECHLKIDESTEDGNNDCMIKCSVCNEQFENDLCLYEHYRNSHINFCESCDEEFQFFHQLLQHKCT